jgi:hypothetical protein
MGREAVCTCTLDGKRFEVKSLLEPPDLILRGDIRRRVPFAAMKRVSADGDELRFVHGAEQFSLKLGRAMAAKWTQAILAPPVTLTKKLGIDAGTRVCIIGKMDDGALQEAIADAYVVSRGTADIVLARVNTSAELDTALSKASECVAKGAALWIVYRKGPGQAISESDVRGAGLAAGIVDVKVASVSPELTALKFVKRKSAKRN